MKEALVGLTSSMGDRKAYLAQGMERISYGNEVLKVSNVYEAPNDSVHKGSSPILSAVTVIKTDLLPRQLLQFLTEIENQLGRERGAQKTLPYHLDLDLLFYESEVLRTPYLTLPHPGAHRRPYVIIPAAEVAGEWEHPVLLKNLKELALEAQSKEARWGQFFGGHDMIAP